MNTLIIIPARKGSKGLPNKNLKQLNFKPLIQYSIEFAQKVAKDEDKICVTTDSDEILKLCNSLNLQVDFKRPPHLASDKAAMNDVIIHAIDFYKELKFDNVLLLQPTSPFRDPDDYKKMKEILLNEKIEQVVSVKMVKDNPFFNSFQLNKEGFLEKLIKTNLVNNRQESPPVFALNGSMYLFKMKCFQKKKNIKDLNSKPFLMNSLYSLDIDSIEDFEYAEFQIKKTC